MSALALSDTRSAWFSLWLPSSIFFLPFSRYLSHDTLFPTNLRQTRVVVAAAAAVAVAVAAHRAATTRAALTMAQALSSNPHPSPRAIGRSVIIVRVRVDFPLENYLAYASNLRFTCVCRSAADDIKSFTTDEYNDPNPFRLDILVRFTNARTLF